MSIYMDNAATTPVLPEVVDAMLPYFTMQFGNPSSLHADGLSAKKALSEARRSIASLLGVKPNEIFFTSGGTESDNWAIKGFCEANAAKGKHIITSKIEHHAVLETCDYLEKQGYEITRLSVDASGLVNPEELRRSLRSDTILVSIMAVNNETGTMEPVEELAGIAAERGVAFHSDCVQAAGHSSMGWLSQITMASLSAHKFGGPKGVGLLYVKEGTKIAQIIHGGGQEQWLRSGTENIPGIVGMAKALELASTGLSEKMQKLSEIREHFLKRLREGLDDFSVNGRNTIPTTISLSFDRVEASGVLVLLDLAGISCSGGSACTSNRNEPSHVLSAMGVGEDRIRGSIRLSFSERNTMEEMEIVADTLIEAVTKLRNMREGR